MAEPEVFEVVEASAYDALLAKRDEAQAHFKARKAKLANRANKRRRAAEGRAEAAEARESEAVTALRELRLAVTGITSWDWALSNDPDDLKYARDRAVAALREALSRHQEPDK